MTSRSTRIPLSANIRRRCAAFLFAVLAAAPAAAQTAATGAARAGDFIVAVVNQELVTNGEVLQRLQRIVLDARRSGASLPPGDELRRTIVDQLIDERAQLSLAKETGARVDEGELERAVANVAAQNQLSVSQLRERLRTEGLDFTRFRNNLRDQLMLERLREREVQSRLRITEADIDAALEQQRTASGASVEYNIAQILVPVRESASPDEVAQRRARAEAALQRARAGGDFAALVAEFSEADKDNDGQIGLRSADRLPDLFVEAVKGLKAGEVAPQLQRSGAGFHVLKLIERHEGTLSVTQNRSRHILLRVSPELTQSAAIARLAQYKRDVEAGRAKFEDLARRNSDDGSAAQGGDLGWASPGQFVPEFEQALSSLQIGEIADPVVSRFGVHLIQLLERRQVALEPREQREMARNMLREQKSEEAYNEWAREVRARAYVEMREPPQ